MRLLLSFQWCNLSLLLELLQLFDELRIIRGAFCAGFLDILQNCANGIDHFEQAIRNRRIQLKLTCPQHRQQTLSRMGEHLQLRKPQKTASSLDRVDRPENAAQELFVFRILFQLDEIVIQPVQVFGAFLQEIID